MKRKRKALVSCFTTDMHYRMMKSYLNYRIKIAYPKLKKGYA